MTDRPRILNLQKRVNVKIKVYIKTTHLPHKPLQCMMSIHAHTELHVAVEENTSITQFEK